MCVQVCVCVCVCVCAPAAQRFDDWARKAGRRRRTKERSDIYIYTYLEEVRPLEALLDEHGGGHQLQPQQPVLVRDEPENEVEEGKDRSRRSDSGSPSLFLFLAHDNERERPLPY